MRIWMITVGEPLPTDGDDVRLLRTGLLAASMAKQGHEVRWWTSNFDHVRKKQRFPGYHVAKMADNYHIHLLHSVSYQRNVSARRIFNHLMTARQFRQKADQFEKPDAIVCSMPTIELTDYAAGWAAKHGVPFITDIRDLWPDLYIQAFPGWARPWAKHLLWPYYRQLKRALRASDGIIGTSELYRNWGLEQCGRSMARFDEVFPLGYEQPIFSPQEIENEKQSLIAKGVDPSKKICWFAGIFGKSYDLHTILEVAKRFQASGTDSVQFVLSGDGDQRAEIEAKAQNIPSVVFTGWLDACGLATMGQMAEIGLASYVRGALQSLPNKIFEYLACEVAILSSLGEEAQNLLATHQCGLSYPPEQAADLESKIRQLINAPELCKTLAINGKKLYEDSFRASRVYKKFEGFLEEVGQSKTH